MFLWIFLCCAQPEPPTCEDTEDHACFRGAFRTLLGGAVEGMKLCTPDLPNVPCVTTGEDGTWKIPGLPKDTDVLVTSEHPDFVPTVFPQNTAYDWYEWYKVALPSWIMDENAKNLDLEVETDKGHLIFLVWEGRNIDGVDTPLVEEVIATLSPTSPNLFYANAFNLANDSMTETGSSGSGGAVNITPGTIDLSLEAPEGTCTEHSFSYAFNEDGSIPIPIKAGYTTAVDVICPVIP
jgi:hypothetical protein